MKVEETRKQKFVRELREVADYVESRPFDDTGHYFNSSSFHLRCTSDVQFGRNVAAAGNATKIVYSGDIHAEAKAGSSATFIVYASQGDVCERVKVGEKTIPAVKEHTISAEPERTEDVFEYRCPDSFLKLKDKPPTDAETEELVSAETDF